MWGQVETVLNNSWDKRIIPTRVGTSPAGQTRLVSHRDHPHACGDKSTTPCAPTGRGGSSPRVWGQGYPWCKLDRIDRIIPTRVGTRTSQYTDLHGYKDHPHACGDKTCLCRYGKEVIGSSPRVWGQGLRKLLCGRRCRIIPTRVGTSRAITILYNQS